MEERPKRSTEVSGTVVLLVVVIIVLLGLYWHQRSANDRLRTTQVDSTIDLGRLLGPQPTSPGTTESPYCSFRDEPTPGRSGQWEYNPNFHCLQRARQ